MRDDQELYVLDKPTPLGVVILTNDMIIRKTQRISYLSALAAFDSGHEDMLKQLVIQTFKNTYRKFFEVYVKYV